MRTSKKFFFEAPASAEGKKFVTHNHPNQEMYQILFDSLLFVADPEDTAKEAEAGHIKTSSDNDAIARTNVFKDGHSRGVKPHQLPSVMTIVDGADTEIATDGNATYEGIKVTSKQYVIPGTQQKRLAYVFAADTTNSITIDSTTKKLSLVNDLNAAAIDSDTNQEKFYGIKNQTRGFYKIFPNYSPGVLTCVQTSPGVFSLIFSNVSSAGTSKAYMYYENDTLVTAQEGIETNLALGFKAIPDTLLIEGTKFRITAHLTMAANNADSNVYLQIHNGTGGFFVSQMCLQSDGGQGCDVLMRAELDVHRYSDEALNLTCTGTGHSSNSQRVHSFSGRNTVDLSVNKNLCISILGARAAGASAEINLNSFNIEIVKL